MRMRAEHVGAFVDAVYAIAVTILALEIPNSLSGGRLGIEEFAGVVVEYAVAFFLLFAFWLQHRRINAMAAEVHRGALWTNAAILLLVCLVPRITTLVFEFGSNVTLEEIEATLLHGAGWSTAELVDLFYVLVIVAIDLGILLLLHLNRGPVQDGAVHQLRRSKVATTVLLVTVVASSFLLPVQNRYFLIVIPVVLFFEIELSSLTTRFRQRG